MCTTSKMVNTSKHLCVQRNNKCFCFLICRYIKHLQHILATQDEEDKENNNQTLEKKNCHSTMNKSISLKSGSDATQSDYFFTRDGVSDSFKSIGSLSDNISDSSSRLSVDSISSTSSFIDFDRNSPVDFSSPSVTDWFH